MKKLLIIALCSLQGSLTFAGEVKGNLDIKVNINSTCTISMTDVNFGEASSSSQVQKDLRVRCNKNTPLTLTTTTANNPEGYRGGYLTMNGKKVTQLGNQPRIAGEGIRYHVWTDNITDNSNFSISYKNTVIGENFNTNGNNHNILNYELKMTVKTDQAFGVPLLFKIFPEDWNNQKYLFPAGLYYDTMTITATY